MSSNEILVRLRGVTKDYRSLRPLRIAELDLHPGRSVALLGFDQMMAEILVDLITGAILPDSGEMVAFGQHDVVDCRSRQLAAPRSISLAFSRIGPCWSSSSRSSRTWHFRCRSRSKSCRRRSAPASPTLRGDRTCGRSATPGRRPRPALRARIRLGRALAMHPSVLVAEHPNATLSRRTPRPSALISRASSRRAVSRASSSRPIRRLRGRCRTKCWCSNRRREH